LLSDSEGSIGSAAEKSTSKLRNYLLNGEYNSPLRLGGLKQMVTVGFDVKHEKLDDPHTMSNDQPDLGVLAKR
jgi:ferric enterobactin receptor